DITEESTEELPAVQVGDPFQEKKLLEACLEVINTGAIVGMQDMGAAGIICSAAEMSAKGNSGMSIHLDKVPARQQNMKAWELLLSESQERMLMVVQRGKENVVRDVFEKWDLPCEEIGEVTEDEMLRFYMNGILEAEIPAKELVLGGGAPQYARDIKRPDYLDKVKEFNPDKIEVPLNLKLIAEKIVTIPSIASKKWIAVQYDSTVGTANSSTNQPSDAAIVLAREAGKALAVTTDCNSRYVYSDPYRGTMIAVAEAARNIVCSGAIPLGVTNCLNFGNPYDPGVYFQFVEAVKGMGEACRKFGTPVTGGNVSFYNQNPDGPIYPTPTIGMVGLLESEVGQMTLDFKSVGDFIILVGKSTNDINSSEYLNKLVGIEYSPSPHFDLDEEYSLQQKVIDLIEGKVVQSAHDVSEGGLFVALVESAIVNDFGFDVIASDSTIRKDAYWFGESQSRVVVSVSPKKINEFRSLMKDHFFEELGVVTEDSVEVDGMNWGSILSWKELYESAIASLLPAAESETALDVL
ncbi:MAG TPA: AIR synthase-related protein, partial [Puia sp.]|nr:AIR synthase-related protein [Puia sp.]